MSHDLHHDSQQHAGDRLGAAPHGAMEAAVGKRTLTMDLAPVQAAAAPRDAGTAPRDPGAASPRDAAQPPQRSIVDLFGRRGAGAESPGATGPAEPARARPPNVTGLPDALRSGIEALSGISLEDVRVHFNSALPATYDAHAIAQGTEIHIAPGQESYLGHEAWHVVQQLQGRASRPSPDGDGPVNDDPALEREADEMAARALTAATSAAPPQRLQSRPPVVQRGKTNKVSVKVKKVKQRKSNLCWAAVGYSLHRTIGNKAHNKFKAFVRAHGNRKIKFRKSGSPRNQVQDIDDIIGSGSGENLLVGSNSTAPFGKNGIAMQLQKGKPIIANVNSDHYVIICGKRSNNGQYEIKIMDPATGKMNWLAATGTGQSISRIGGYALSVLYYVK